jgi:hypothetical protein
MNGTIEITYQVEDGYVGKSRPQGYQLDISGLEFCDSINEAMQYVDEATQEDFENRISWTYSNYDEIVEDVTAYLNSKKGE